MKRVLPYLSIMVLLALIGIGILTILGQQSNGVFTTVSGGSAPLPQMRAHQDSYTAATSAPAPTYAPSAPAAESSSAMSAAAPANAPAAPAPPVAPQDEALMKDYGVNSFSDTHEDTQSTFAMDVDTASYTLVRGYIENGQLPPSAAVRTEEFINYFRQDYPSPQDGAFAIVTELAPTPFDLPGHQMLRVGIQGKRIDPADRAPATLIFVVDVSGSMNVDNRLPLVKRSLKLLVDQLNPNDRVGIVAYGNTAFDVLAPTEVAQRDQILNAIEQLTIQGSTNAEAGLLQGYAMASSNLRPGDTTRVILCSDGVANVGNTGPEAILRTISDYSNQGINLTTVGFGMGSFNDYLMEQLANQGDGMYAYVDTIEQARRMFASQLTGSLEVIARDAKVQVQFNPEVVERYRLLGYENRAVADQDFRNDAVDAGEVGAGHSVTALYELVLRDTASADAALGTVALRYQEPEGEAVREVEAAISAAGPANFEAAAFSFRRTVTVAAFAELLRGGYWQQTTNLATVAELAQRLSAEQPEDLDVAEFARLTAQAAQLGNASIAPVPPQPPMPVPAPPVPAPPAPLAQTPSIIMLGIALLLGMTGLLLMVWRRSAIGTRDQLALGLTDAPVGRPAAVATIPLQRRHCRHCDTALEPGADFCHHCGQVSKK